MKTLTILLAALLLATACTSGKTSVDSNSTDLVRPDEGSQSGVILEETAPSFIAE